MTAKELLTEVSSLGFGHELSANMSFICATNRSLRRIFGERQIMGEHTFFARSQKPLNRFSYLAHNGGEPEVLTVLGDVFSAFAHGNGYITVSAGDAEQVYSFNGSSVRIIGELYGKSTVKLCGTSKSYFTDFVTYEGISAETDEIPDGSSTVKYSASDMVSDLHSLIGVPTDGSGHPLPQIGIVSNTLYVPSCYTGNISFRYLKKAPTVTGADLDDELDIPEDCKEALALLIASYVYLDKDPKLAEHYGELYREAMSRSPKPTPITYSSGYRDTNGWA